MRLSERVANWVKIMQRRDTAWKVSVLLFGATKRLYWWHIGSMGKCTYTHQNCYKHAYFVHSDSKFVLCYVTILCTSYKFHKEFWKNQPQRISNQIWALHHIFLFKSFHFRQSADVECIKSLCHLLSSSFLECNETFWQPPNHKWTQTHMYTHIHAHTHTSHTHTCTHITHKHMYAHTYARTYTHTHACVQNTHTHTHNH